VVCREQGAGDATDDGSGLREEDAAVVCAAELAAELAALVPLAVGDADCEGAELPDGLTVGVRLEAGVPLGDAVVAAGVAVPLLLTPVVVLPVADAVCEAVALAVLEGVSDGVLVPVGKPDGDGVTEGASVLEPLTLAAGDREGELAAVADTDADAAGGATSGHACVTCIQLELYPITAVA